MKTIKLLSMETLWSLVWTSKRMQAQWKWVISFVLLCCFLVKLTLVNGSLADVLRLFS